MYCFANANIAQKKLLEDVTGHIAPTLYSVHVLYWPTGFIVLYHNSYKRISFTDGK